MDTIVNTKLMNVLTDEKLIELGFERVEYKDTNNLVRAVDWQIKNDNFHLILDLGVPKLYRVNPDTDEILIHVETLSELENLVNWIAD